MEIRPEDLFHRCTACGGDGIISPPQPAEVAPVVEIGRKCDRCGGKGMMLTDSGTVLKALFQMLQDGKI
ncbi:MAG: hypothetical protein K8U03_26030 [Planctomycetia bacterium]|nr:hypothetical protein [Planctomycetia bacterium]